MQQTFTGRRTAAWNEPIIVINALAGWGISANSEQLKSLNSEFVEGVYCACLQRVTDLSHDSESLQDALTAQAEDKVF